MRVRVALLGEGDDAEYDQEVPQYHCHYYHHYQHYHHYHHCIDW